jgi:hypothetical protein
MRRKIIPTVQNLYGHFLYRSKLMRVTTYTGQNLYGTNFIQLKIYTVIFYTGQNLYSTKFIQDEKDWSA